jgi:hypothetical protein
MNQTETQTTVREQELVVYHLVDRDFEWGNIYAMGGTRPNAKFIASQYGCRLEFRQSQFRETGPMRFFPSYLERRGIAKDGSCTSAVLIGENREKLARARDDIQRTFGVANFNDGAVDVGRDKTIFG